MKFGIAGLGLMGGNLARAAPERGLESWASPPTSASGAKLADDGPEAVPSLELLVASARSSAVRRRSVAAGRRTQALLSAESKTVQDACLRSTRGSRHAH